MTGSLNDVIEGEMQPYYISSTALENMDYLSEVLI